MKKAFWKADWFLGLVIAFALFGFARMSGFIPGLERWAYDLGVNMTAKNPSDKVQVIAIDERSLENIGRWPWPRDVQARMIDQLAAAKVKVIGSTVFFSEPQKDPGLVYVEKMLDVYNKAYPGAVADVPGVSPIGGATPAAQAALPPGEVGEIGKILSEASVALNTDTRLAESMKKAGNVLVPMNFGDSSYLPPQGKPDKPLPEYVTKNTIGGFTGAGGGYLYGLTASVPIEKIGTASTGIGHLTSVFDADGATRFEPLVIDFYGQQYPSMALLLAAKSLNLTAKDIKVKLGESVTVGGKTIRTDDFAQMYTYFYKDRGQAKAFPEESFYDVMTGKVPASRYADKIVLIGATAPGMGASQVTPISAGMSPVQTLAHSVSSILQEHFFVAPTWGAFATLGAYILIALYITLMLPRLSAGKGAVISATLLVALFGAHLGLMTGAGLWVQLMLPATLLVVGHALLTTKHYLVTERGKEKADTESAESNRMLGLAFQQQGQLDMAFDKFRKAPLNEEVMENMYSLALDFERRRQFNKAESVFRYMTTYDPKFRDIGERLGRNKQLSETIILGGSSAARTNASTMVLQGGAQEKPMLGRYQIEKELGKGAMGVVYGGKDPKIGRVVAIKTMALSEEFEAEELKEAKERFFREAETAGRLNHPNIVTIFDAGEEHDLCYIAMEFLKGKDLVQHTKMPNLLAPDKVLSIVERVADALSYAHGMGIVHRDIKPANIMYEAESDTPKVTDFGIARVTDSSKTKTGMVLGTPSYMSPEQLAGKRIDGRSDLFSLGVTLYQMLSGRLPFEGESMTQLMFAIANNPHPPIRDYNPALPPWIDAIIEQALAKDFDKRYQTGAEFAAAIRAARKAGAGATAAHAGN
ncbi:MAG TPA: CHASE2 domain-containing protein [Usitatibacter sp.]|nr:CHASE2 domain-containing protein [Usitatibacter sp.]